MMSEAADAARRAKVEAIAKAFRKNAESCIEEYRAKAAASEAAARFCDAREAVARFCDAREATARFCDSEAVAAGVRVAAIVEVHSDCVYEAARLKEEGG